MPAAAQMAAQLTDVETSKRYEVFDLAGLMVGVEEIAEHTTERRGRRGCGCMCIFTEAELILHKAKEVCVKSEPEAEF